MNKHYYRFMGYADKSGKPFGRVIKCYTADYADYLRLNGVVLELID